MVILHEIRAVGNLTDTFTHMQPSYFIHFIEHLTHKKITIPGAPAPLHILYTGTSKIVIFVEVAFGETHPPSNGAVYWGFREGVIIGDFAYNFRKMIWVDLQISELFRFKRGCLCFVHDKSMKISNPISYKQDMLRSILVSIFRW